MIRQHRPQTREENLICIEQEKTFNTVMQNVSDEDLLAYLKKCYEELGRLPKRYEIVGFEMLKRRFGPWPRVLEKAGLKEKSEKRIEIEQKRGRVNRRKRK